jgi:nitrite reductase (NADH) large subunit
MKQKLVIIGAGMASGRMLDHLFAQSPDAYDVTLFGAEPRGNYNRIMLSPVLAGEKVYDDIVTHDAAWYAAHGVTCRFGETVTAIDRRRKVVVSRNGETPYDKLVIATGSAPFIVPVAGKDLPGVMAFRDLDDVNRMVAAADKPGAKAVVIGGGLLGLEAAAALRLRGMEVVVIHLMGHVMERQLDPAAGLLLQRELEARGIAIHTRASTKAILGNERVEAVALEDGTVYPADIVVMAVGIRPETRIATDAGLHVERGIVVNDRLETADPSIFALGECAEHRGICYGLVAPLYEMAEALATLLAGGDAAYTGSAISTRLKVTGVDVFSAGDFAAGADREEIVMHDDGGGTYRRLVLKDGQLIGAVLYGETADGAWYFDKLRGGAAMPADRATLAFGSKFEDSPALDAYGGRSSLTVDA